MIWGRTQYAECTSPVASGPFGQTLYKKQSKEKENFYNFDIEI